MVRDRVYLDHNATAPLRPEAVAAMAASLGCGNPSSVHAEGRRARAIVERARAQVSDAIGARPVDVVFTSGGTEANADALRPGALLTPAGASARRLLVGATEHVSVLRGHAFPPDVVEMVPVDGTGCLDLDRLAALLDAAGEGAVVAVQAANSETGVLQPVAAIADLAHARGAALHVDAVQAAGRLPVDLAAWGADSLALSAHKLGGPAGAGALVVAPGRRGPARPLLGGGGQESGARAGTENVYAIAGFGVALARAVEDLACEASRLGALRDEAEARLRALAPNVVVFGATTDRLPNTLAFAVPGLKAETALIGLDLAGVAVSSGSACASGTVGRSHVLAAMGVPLEHAAGAVRISFGWTSTQHDVKRWAEAFGFVLQRLYESGRARAA